MSLIQNCNAFNADCQKRTADEPDVQELCNLDCSGSCEDLLSGCAAFPPSNDIARVCRDAFPQCANLPITSRPSPTLNPSGRIDDATTSIESSRRSSTTTTSTRSTPSLSSTSRSTTTETSSRSSNGPTTITSSPTFGNTSVAPTETAAASGDGGLSVGAKAAIGVVIPLVMIALIAGLVLLWRRRRSADEIDPYLKFGKETTSYSDIPAFAPAIPPYVNQPHQPVRPTPTQSSGQNPHYGTRNGYMAPHGYQPNAYVPYSAADVWPRYDPAAGGTAYAPYEMDGNGMFTNGYARG